MIVANIWNIPNFISAPTPKGMREAMLKNNLKKGIQFHYFDIQFVKGSWIAWFNEAIERNGIFETKVV